MFSCLPCFIPKNYDATLDGTVTFSTPNRGGSLPEGEIVKDLAKQVLSQASLTEEATSKHVAPPSKVSHTATGLREALAKLTNDALKQQAEHNVKEDKFNSAREILAEKLGGKKVTGFKLTGAPIINHGPASYSSIQDAFAAGNKGASSQASSAPSSPRGIIDGDAYAGSSVKEREAFLKRIGAQALFL